MRIALATLLVITWAAAAAAQDAAAALQGRWIVTGAEHNGKPMKGLDGGVMTVTSDAFEIRTASGNVLKGRLRLDDTVQPNEMDLIHADGTHWEAVYEATGDALRLNYVAKGGKDPRPKAFTTSETTEESLIVLRRQSK
jgi:uncharacterized protein (TIGR03067 family)